MADQLPSLRTEPAQQEIEAQRQQWKIEQEQSLARAETQRAESATFDSLPDEDTEEDLYVTDSDQGGFEAGEFTDTADGDKDQGLDTLDFDALEQSTPIQPEPQSGQPNVELESAKWLDKLQLLPVKRANCFITPQKRLLEVPVVIVSTW